MSEHQECGNLAQAAELADWQQGLQRRELASVARITRPMSAGSYPRFTIVHDECQP